MKNNGSFEEMANTSWHGLAFCIAGARNARKRVLSGAAWRNEISREMKISESSAALAKSSLASWRSSAWRMWRGGVAKK